ncbi:MAG: YcgL domain-containing protein [Halobacteria archaeon]|nr:YcgL domain-containing protein [Halobacteria archaeon]
MHCCVYKSLRKQETFLFVLQEDDFSKVPEPLLNALGEIVKIIDLELTPERKVARGEARYIIEDLLERGFHLQLPPTEKPEPIS